MWDIDSHHRVPTPPSVAVLTNSSRTMSIIAVGSSFATSDQISFCMVDVIYIRHEFDFYECNYFVTSRNDRVC